MSTRAVIGWWVGGVFTVLLLITAASFAIATPVYYVQKNGCYSFGRETEREVRWVMYNIVSWDCLTPAKDGKWIPTKRLRDVD